MVDSQSSGGIASQIPSQTALDEQGAVYIQAFNRFEEVASSAVNEKPRASPPPSQEQPEDVSFDATTSSISLSILNFIFFARNWLTLYPFQVYLRQVNCNQVLNLKKELTRKRGDLLCPGPLLMPGRGN